MTTSPAAPMTLRCTEDLLAAVPVSLGFVPEESVVMLAVVGRRCFQARIDLPVPGVAEELAVVVDALVEPVVAHGVQRVALVVYGDEPVHAARVVRALEEAMARRGVEVFDAVRVHEGHWWPARGRREGVPAHGVAFEASTHEFTARAVVAGQVVLDSRGDLAATVAPLPDVVREVDRLVARARGGSGARPGPGSVAEQGQWVASLVLAHRADRAAPGAAVLARLLPALCEVGVRDAAWAALTRAGDGDCARTDAGFWVEVVRRSPPGLRVAPAALLALAAWSAGQGALAWCAVDVARAAQADYALTELVAELLERAVPPGSWHPEAG